MFDPRIYYLTRTTALQPRTAPSACVPFPFMWSSNAPAVPRDAAVCRIDHAGVGHHHVLKLRRHRRVHHRYQQQRHVSGSRRLLCQPHCLPVLPLLRHRFLRGPERVRANLQTWPGERLLLRRRHHLYPAIQLPIMLADATHCIRASPTAEPPAPVSRISARSSSGSCRWWVTSPSEWGCLKRDAKDTQEWLYSDGLDSRPIRRSKESLPPHGAGEVGFQIDRLHDLTGHPETD